MARLRKITGERSIGHLGTLDPMATGVLPLLLGKFTRLAQFFSSEQKSYSGTIRFGYATDTYDAEGECVGPHLVPVLTLEQVRDAAVQVEFTPSSTGNPTSIMQNGIPGVIEVAVERVAPANLVLRATGLLLSRSMRRSSANAAEPLR